MRRYNRNTATERKPTIEAPVLRLIICVLGTGLLFTVLFGQWVFHLQLVVGGIFGVSLYILFEILLLIRQDAYRVEMNHPKRVTIKRKRWRRRSE
jgi:hypothetical protein